MQNSSAATILEETRAFLDRVQYSDSACPNLFIQAMKDIFSSVRMGS